MTVCEDPFLKVNPTKTVFVSPNALPKVAQRIFFPPSITVFAAPLTLRIVMALLFETMGEYVPFVTMIVSPTPAMSIAACMDFFADDQSAPSPVSSEREAST
ncbi:MAG: hypothetical protein FWG05_03945 [Kiritimatiellaeota bacterium]|nr:hypothetical protein [Kiritimatiellota bacterium]